MYRTILIPTDGSAGSTEALRHGIDLAHRYDATVHLVYIVDEGIFGHYGGIDAIEHAEEALEERGREVLRAARDRVEASSLSVETHVEHATPHEGILDTARRVGADLVVMGTERQSDEYRRLLGSVSERVIRTSPVPVHLVKADRHAESGLTIRRAVESDVDAIRAVAERSLKSSYSSILDEEDLEHAIEHWYGAESVQELLADPLTVVLVAVADDAVVGFSQSHLVDTPAGTTGEIHWLHVDPESRGTGIGSMLYDRTITALAEHDVDRVAGLVLAASEPGNAFYRAQGLERVASRTVRLGGESYEENVYAPPGAAEEIREPRVEPHTTASGETRYVNYEEREIGSEGPFFAAYTDPELQERYVWFCSNCETFDNAMDPMGRIVCNQCGNHHKATRWDAVATE